MDNQGFEAHMVAYRMQIPADWSATGEVLWRKPCSGNELFETVITLRAPDGLTGLRLLPGHQVLWTQHELYGDPQMTALWAAQQEAERNKLRSQWQGSNCHVAPISRPEDLFQALVLSKRPAGTRVTDRQPIAEVMDSYRQLFAGDPPGAQTFFDASTYELQYTLAGQPVTERITFSWVLFQTEIRDPGLSMLTQSTLVNAMHVEWVLDARAVADRAKLAAIGASLKVDPDWQAKIQEVQRRHAERRRQDAEETAAQRDARRKRQEMLNDSNHRRFLQQIWQ